MNKRSSKAPLPRRCLIFTGQPSITDEIDRLITCYVSKYIINVEITSGGEKHRGRLEKSSHPDRINIRHEDYSFSVATIAFITELIHDLVPERTTTLSPSGARA